MHKSSEPSCMCEDKMMLYCIKNLHRIAHGSFDTAIKLEQDSSLKSEHRLNVIDIPVSTRHKIDPRGVSVFRPGSEIFDDMAKQVKGTLHQDIFDIIMQSDRSYFVNGSRGKDTRLYLGFNRGQSNSILVNGDPKLKIPATHTCEDVFLDKLEETSNNRRLKYELSAFFRFIQDVVVNKVNNGKALNDTKQSNLLGPFFNERHFPGRGLL